MTERMPVSQDRAEEFLSRFPRVGFVDIRGAGHMVAGDRNDVFAGAVLDFLGRLFFGCLVCCLLLIPLLRYPYGSNYIY